MIDLITKYRHLGLLLDTNLFVVLIIGLIDKGEIGRNKRTQAYSQEDFELLFEFINYFTNIVITPQILAETSNLIDVFTREKKSAPFLVLKQLLEDGQFKEESIPSIKIVKTHGFERFGLTDSGLVELAAGKYLILTDDLKVANYAYEQLADIINFNHVRDLVWELQK